MSHVARQTHGESFLYLYLSLMIAIFSIVTVLSLRNIRASEKHLTNEAASSLDNGKHTIHGAPVTPYTKYPIEIFEKSAEGTTSISAVGYSTLLFLLHSHDVNAVIEIEGSLENPEQSYADVLTLQQRLEQERLSPEDVRVELIFSSNERQGDALVTFYPDR